MGKRTPTQKAWSFKDFFVKIASLGSRRSTTNSIEMKKQGIP